MLIAGDARRVKHTAQDLPMIQPNCKIVEAEFCQDFTGRCADLSFHHQRSRSQHINITLIKLAKSSTCGSIRSPHWLNLVTLKKLRQLIAILSYHSGQRHSQVITKRQISLARACMNTTLQNFEDELIAFLTILAHQRFDVLYGRRLEWLKAVALVNFLDDADDILAPPHIRGEKVAHASRRLVFGGHTGFG